MAKYSRNANKYVEVSENFRRHYVIHQQIHCTTDVLIYNNL